MARKPAAKPAKSGKDIGKCRECEKSYDYHEMTNYEPKRPFLCKCPHEQWSQFLDHLCVNGHFVRRKTDTNTTT